MNPPTESLQGTNWLTVLRSRAFLLAVIPLLWLIAYLPALGARDMRLEEGRRATPAAEMLRSGNFIKPTLYGEPYLSKPPLFFWVAAAMGKLQGHVTTWSVRIPSVLSVLLGAWLLLSFGARTLPREARALAALLFMSMPTMLDKGTLGEIDALLSLVTFAAVAVWWHFYDATRAKVAPWGWIGAGILLGLSILMKGPGGAAEFYAVLAGFAIFARRGRTLLSPWHLVMLLLAILPVALWVKALLADTGMSLKDLTAIWSHQTGVDVVAGTSGALWKKIWIDHYLLFAFRALADLLPWVAIGITGACIKPRPTTSTQTPPAQRDLWSLLAAAWPMLLAIFWIWPKGSPRYMMMAAYPVALLAAWVIIQRRNEAISQKTIAFLRSAGAIMTLAAGIIGGAAIVLSIQLKTGEMPTTIVVVAASILLAAWARWLTKRTPTEGLPIASAANLALIILLGWGMLTSVLLPAKAKSDPTRILHDQIKSLVPTDIPVYTTRTFLSGHGDDYYNAQFYLPGQPTAINNFSKLPPGKSTVILAPEEWDTLKGQAEVRELGRLDAKKKGAPPAVIVAEVIKH